jgi:hypothetical protein
MADTNPPRVIADIHAPRATIRAELLPQTPLGSSTADAINFISNRLQRSRRRLIDIVVDKQTAVY